MKPTITIIGAGISGLTAAVYLHQNGFNIQIIEASDRAGGRIKTDVVNGFRLDRGFQVLLTEYPECKALLNYKKLNLKRFLPGATVLYDGGQFEIADPFRRPSATFSTLFAPVGSIKDKINTLFLKNKLVKITIPEIFNQKEEPTLSQLSKYGFSDKMINRFYKPFFSGIFLENELSTSNRMFDFVMKMFSQGDAAIPELGMEEIPKQLAAILPKDTIKYNVKVTNIQNNTIETENGSIFTSDKIIIATEATGFAKRYLPETQTKSHQVTNIYFQANGAPTNKAVVILNASKNKKWVNNLSVMTNLSSSYAPKGKVLLSVSINGIVDIEEEVLASNIKNELKQWFGNQVENWELLKIYKINYALPNLKSLKENNFESDFKINENLFICGDHLLNGSINAAMKSGRTVAENIIKNHLD
ncbi:NAD(P)/FAD-dependent oxidoreductase [Flavobacterium sp.]|uniref:NAD(P)/FAD-dependent oxidoreductase n=1 Tax=Flavobacterium sp. TaxID=239 RepID=UPI003751217D